jgi:hypothetical protein
VKRGARIAALSALGLALALALGGALAWWKRCELVEWLARRELAARGAPAELRVLRIDLRGAEIADLRLGAAPDLALERVALTWSREGLRAGRLDRVSLHGVRLRARIDEGGARLGSLDALLASLPAGDASAPLALPFLEAALTDAEATLDSPQGVLRVRAEGHAQPEGDVLRATLALHGESPQGAIDFGGGATYGLASQEIAASGALGGVTPWGSANGFVRAFGTFSAMRGEFSGNVLPAASLGARASEPIAFEGFATRAADGAIAAEGTLVARGFAWEETLRVQELMAKGTLRGEEGAADFTVRGIELPDLAQVPLASARARMAPDGALEATLEAARALAPGLARLEGLRADLRWVEGELTGKLEAERLVELSQPALIAPLRVDATLSGPLERLALRGHALTPGDGLRFDFTGALEPERERVELRIVLAETDFAPKARQPQRVFPWLDGVVTGASGKLGGEALALYEGGQLAASALVAFAGTDLRTVHGSIQGLTGVISVTEPDPLVTPPGQLLWMRGADVGVPLQAGTVRFELRREGVLRIEHGEWALAGGKITLAGDVELEADEQRVELDAVGVRLDELLAALDFEGLSGTGVLEGTIPVRNGARGTRIENGLLHAIGEGVVRFTSGAGGEALAKRQPAISPVLGALTDLRYEELTLTLNGDATDRLDVKIQVKGRNPNFKQGRPVVLNVNVDLPASLLKAMTQTAELTGTTAPESVLEALKALGGAETQ